jgi:hypothetical protein
VWRASSCFPRQLLGNPGFETGTAPPWTVTSPSEINNNPAQPPRTGQWDAWLAPTPTTPQLLAQTVVAPSGCASATLSFWLHRDRKNGTGTGTLTVQLLNGAGTVVATLASFPDAATVGYTQFSYNVLPYAGQAITVRFNSTQSGTKRSNFVIDDTALTVS